MLDDSNIPPIKNPLVSILERLAVLEAMILKKK